MPLDPDLAHAEQVYRRLALVDTAPDTLFAHHLAYLRTFASPRIAALLTHTGHVEHAPSKRATDTGLMIYEILHHGLDSPRAAQVIGAVNTMHGRWSIRPHDYLWVLGTFVVPSTRFLDRFAWHRPTAVEREATATWFAALGARMGLDAVPDTYAGFEALVEDYEAAELERTDAGERLLAASLPVTEVLLPAVLVPRTRTLFSVLFDDGARRALGLAAPSRLLRAAVGAGMLARSIAARPRPGAPPSFVPGAAYGPYADGYAVTDLGVGDAVLRP